MAYIPGEKHCTDWLGDKPMSNDQRTCIEVLCGGLNTAIYNIPTNWKKMQRIGDRGIIVSIRTSGLSTYDWDELTGIVIAAHKELVRVSVMPGGPKMLTIMLVKRQATGEMSQRHPDIDDLISRIEKTRQSEPMMGEVAS
jgi:hypothetical protein